MKKKAVNKASEKTVDPPPTTGVPELDRLVGGISWGDNIVLEVNSGAPIDSFVSHFISANEKDEIPLVYVSFNRSPQTITSKYADMMKSGRFILIDCFSSGKGNDDDVFMDFFKTTPNSGARSIHVSAPEDPAQLQQALLDIRSGSSRQANYLFDSLTGMLDLWGDEDKIIRFFGHICPQLYDLNTIACWYLETEAHGESFLAKLRHITQVVIEIGVQNSIKTLTVRKAANRPCPDIGSPMRFEVAGDKIAIALESREDRELKLLAGMSKTLGYALDPESFFNGTIKTLAEEFGMTRGTLVMLDRPSDSFKIVAAYGLTKQEMSKGVYAAGEGIIGHVAKTGEPEIVPDAAKDPRFLHRAVLRNATSAPPVSFISVPLKVDEEVVGVLSVDKPFAMESLLQKDLRLLSIVGSIVSQVVKINHLIKEDKDEILSRGTHFCELRKRYRLDNVIGESEQVRNVLNVAATAARSKASILITGETGTGKELVVNVIHYNSDRAAGPLVKVNCGALPETLLESELFGHVKGAFTGAMNDRKGRFEAAHGGTLFLDEITEIGMRLQVKLLRAIQEREFEPVGSSKTISVNVRIVAATNRNLKDEIRHGRFREDLFYRLNVIPIHLPPLRERREDIPLLISHFLDKYNAENGKNVRKLSREALSLLVEYPWVGNVRELENCIEHAVVMSPAETLLADLLPAEILEHRQKAKSTRLVPASADLSELKYAVEKHSRNTTDLAGTRDALIRLVEETLIRAGLQKGFSQRALAVKLGISRMTLRKKMSDYGINPT